MHKSLGLRISDRNTPVLGSHLWEGNTKWASGVGLCLKHWLWAQLHLTSPVPPWHLRSWRSSSEIQECAQGSSQSHQYHSAAGTARQAIKCVHWWAIKCVYWWPSQRAGAGRKPPKCRLGFVSPTWSNHQLSNKNACEGCANSLRNHSSELWWPQHRLTCSYWCCNSKVNPKNTHWCMVATPNSRRGKKEKNIHKKPFNYIDSTYLGGEEWNFET